MILLSFIMCPRHGTSMRHDGPNLANAQTFGHGMTPHLRVELTIGVLRCQAYFCNFHICKIVASLVMMLGEDMSNFAILLICRHHASPFGAQPNQVIKKSEFGNLET